MGVGWLQLIYPGTLDRPQPAETPEEPEFPLGGKISLTNLTKSLNKSAGKTPVKKVLVIFGTRPEAIKLAPVITRLKDSPRFETQVAVTGQHRQMLDQVLSLFSLTPDYDLALMSPDQDLFDITLGVLGGLKNLLAEVRPDLVLVQGDTTTTLAAALSAFYYRIPIGHVEAGLRTRDKYRPYPEEANRRLVTILTDYHFAPTEVARANLLAEGVPPAAIYVTGNPVIDALKLVAARVQQERAFWFDYFSRHFHLNWAGRRLILVTGHRRENFGPGLENLCRALGDLVARHPDIQVVYPVHLNPRVQGPVWEILGGRPGADRVEESGSFQVQAPGGGRLVLLPPLAYAPFVFLLSQAYLAVTDSGGIQEEAPALGKPVLVVREVTERPEALQAGAVKLVGPNRERIVREAGELLNNSETYKKMARAVSPYGDGQAARRIVDLLEEKLPELRAK